MNNSKRTKEGEALTRLILQLFPLHGLLGAAGDKLTAPWGLSTARWKVLGAIAQKERALHVSQIARDMGLTRQAVQRVVNDLIEKEFLELSDNPDHRRARLVSMTQRGKNIFNEIMEAQVLWSNKLADGIDLQTLNTTVHVMEAISKQIEQPNKSNEID